LSRRGTPDKVLAFVGYEGMNCSPVSNSTAISVAPILTAIVKFINTYSGIPGANPTLVYNNPPPPSASYKFAEDHVDVMEVLRFLKKNPENFKPIIDEVRKLLCRYPIRVVD